MAIELEERREGEIVILSVKGAVSVDEGQQLKEKVIKIVNGGVKKIIIDFSGIKHINTDGLGGLFAARGCIKENNGVLKITGIEVRVQHVLETTKTTKLFDCYKTIEEAMASFLKEGGQK